MPILFKKPLKPLEFIGLLLIYFLVFLNQSFWYKAIAELPAVWRGSEIIIGFSLLLTLAFLLSTLLVITYLVLAKFPKLFKPTIGVWLWVALVCSYFMDHLGVVIDQGMILNALQTDFRETKELLNIAVFWHFIKYGLLSTLFIIYYPIEVDNKSRTILLKYYGIFFLILIAWLGLQYKTVSLWIREHRVIRMYPNPTFPIYSLSALMVDTFKSPRAHLKKIAIDAYLNKNLAHAKKPTLVIMVVGETARRSNFQLFGYPRPTNPQLAKVPDLLAFSQVVSCGTATLISVPCMFSNLGRAGFSREQANAQENVLDVLQRLGVSVWWRDNNSDCKGVCTRIPTDNLLAPEVLKTCGREACFDEILLKGVAEKINAQTNSQTKDHLIVLHMMGSHGPAYYKRYPDSYRQFTPDCAQDNVEKCSKQALLNAYDNTIVYTDAFLAKTIELLKKYQDTYQVNLLYVSDHGESLGENNIYLHGLPYWIAPQQQKEVPLLMWSPHKKCAAELLAKPYSHDNIFHTLLGLYRVQTTAYQADKDLLADCEYK